MPSIIRRHDNVPSLSESVTLEETGKPTTRNRRLTNVLALTATTLMASGAVEASKTLKCPDSGSTNIIQVKDGNYSAATGKCYIGQEYTVEISNQATLTNPSDGNFKILGNGTQGGKLANLGGAFTNSGPLIVQSGASLGNSDDGKITNGSGANLTNSGNLYNNSGSTLTNEGTLINEGTISNNGSISNSGTVNLEFNSTLGGSGTFTQTAGTTTVNGSLTQTTINLDGGLLNGSGSVFGQFNQNGGIFSPGNSPGMITINGDYYVNGTVAIQLYDQKPGFYDIVDVNGIVTFGINALIDIDLTQNAAQAGGQFWDFIWSDTTFVNSQNVHYEVTGLAAGLGYSIHEVSVGNRHALEFSLVPEPGSLSLFAIGLAGLGFARTRARPT